MNILDKQIDEEVAEYILAKLDESIKQVNENYNKKKERFIKYVNEVIDQEKEQLREEYSARLLSKIKEKNEQIDELENEVERYKEELTERVHAFLSNSKEEVRSLVEEEIRTDGEHLRAERVLEEIKNLVSDNDNFSIESVDETRVRRLEEDLQILKERLESKTAVNETLKARLRAYELCESIPTSDREFYISQLGNLESVNEVENRFKELKRAARTARLQLIEEASEVESDGVIVEDDIDRRPFVPDASGSVVLERMKKLAGIK